MRPIKLEDLTREELIKLISSNAFLFRISQRDLARARYDYLHERSERLDNEARKEMDEALTAMQANKGNFRKYMKASNAFHEASAKSKKAGRLFDRATEIFDTLICPRDDALKTLEKRGRR